MAQLLADPDMAQLLADPDTAIDAKAKCGCTALHLAAHDGNYKVVERLLSDDRTLVNAKNNSGRTALYIATKTWHDKVVSLLLAQDSIEIDRGRFILSMAVVKENDEIISQLLAKSSAQDFLRWVNVYDGFGWNAFHMAVSYGRDQVVTQLLTLSPALIHELSSENHNALQIAVRHGAESVFGILLKIRPEWAFSVDDEGNTLLHLAANSSWPLSPEAFTRLWELSPGDDSARRLNNRGESPFLIAVRNRDDFAIDLMQWKFSFDEIVAVVTAAKGNNLERFRRVMETELAAQRVLLCRDIVGMVSKFL